MTIEEINTKIKAVEKLKTVCEDGRDRAFALYAEENDADAGLYYLGWVEKVEACERESKRLHSERAELILHGNGK